MTRRRRGLAYRLALALLLCGAAPSGLGPATPVAGERGGRLLVTVAEVADDRAVLWLRAGAAERLRVRVVPVDDAAGGRRFEVQARPDWDHIVRVPLQGLRPAARYAYEVESGGERVEGSFTSAPPAEAAARVRRGEIVVDGGRLTAWIRDGAGTVRAKLKLSAEERGG